MLSIVGKRTPHGWSLAIKHHGHWRTVHGATLYHCWIKALLLGVTA